ncbi:MAG: hypothetical protein K2H39_02820, partial [Paramuribaculum sp.]|nr:hypothetical protein [Paramuribaculum sp.]
AFIGQGNTTVCIRDTRGDIMWSWHIWTTDYDPYDPSLMLENQTKGTIKIPNNIGEVYDFMQINLGWVHAEDLESGPRRTIYWRPVQNRGKAIIQPSTVHNKKPDVQAPGKFTTKNKYRISQDHYLASHSGYAPYYNWGRKDALLRTIHMPFPASFVTPAVVPGKYSYRWLFDNTDLTSDGHSIDEGYWYYGNFTMAQSHRIPWPLMCDYNAVMHEDGKTWEGTTDVDYYTTWWTGKYTSVTNPSFVPVTLANQPIRPMGHFNGTNGNLATDYDRFDDLWCIGQNSTTYLDEIDGSAQHQVIKSVYDPCPPDFMVPPNRAFDKINQTDGDGSWVMIFSGNDMTGFGYGKYVFAQFGLELPGMPYLSSRIGGGGDSQINSERAPQCDRIEELVRPGYPDMRYCFPMEEILFGNTCSLWTADISIFNGGGQNGDIIGGSIFNITGPFSTTPGPQLGANGPTAQEARDPRPASGFGWSSGARHIRPVREK